MKKLKLNLADLEVQSFETNPLTSQTGGTVHGRWTTEPMFSTCVTYDWNCYYTEAPTCHATCQGALCTDASCGCPFSMEDTCIYAVTGPCNAECNSSYETCPAICETG